MYKVSQYSHVEDNFSKDYDLDTWLRQTIDPPVTLLNKVENYRQTLSKEDKNKLPLITVSANFKGIRSTENVNEHLPFICLDIDRTTKKKRGKCNTCIDMQLVKEMFMEHPSTYFCGNSVSDDGVYAILKLKEVGKLDKYFYMLQEKLNRIGINIDEVCKDITRLRFFSHDSEAYYNINAVPLSLPVERKEFINTMHYDNDDFSKVERLCKLIEMHSIDITSGYDDWIKIGSVLNNNFGERGRVLFHRISKFHSEYKTDTCDRKYDNCSKMNLNNIGLIVNLCKDYGLL